MDAGSDDKSARIEHFVSGVRKITLGRTILFGAAINAASLYAVAATVLVLDNGIEIAFGSVAAARRHLLTGPSIAAVGGKMIRPGRTYEAGGAMSSGATARPLHICAVVHRLRRKRLRGR